MSETVEPVQPVLEPAAAAFAAAAFAEAAFAEATAHPPYLFDLPPAEGREAVDEVQSGAIAKPAVDEEWSTCPAGRRAASARGSSSPPAPRAPSR